MHKSNYFYRFRKDKTYQRLLKEEGAIVDIVIAMAEARKRKRLTQAQLAKKVGMPQSQIARIESGNHNVTIGTLNRVASALKLSIKVAA
jgi:predicted transcriptional regulator